MRAPAWSGKGAAGHGSDWIAVGDAGHHIGIAHSHVAGFGGAMPIILARSPRIWPGLSGELALGDSGLPSGPVGGSEFCAAASALCRIAVALCFHLVAGIDDAADDECCDQGARKIR